ncbi:MAG: type II toxin-antitoxin system VapB family antitoxin [Tagaea sp.]|nr:type II toxin-antitoxin system VapB family antitoxin [Tagaea sp.]
MTPPDDPVLPPEPTVWTLDEARAAIARHRAAGSPPVPPDEVERRLAAMQSIVARARALPRLSDASEDEILGYDENGIPT